MVNHNVLLQSCESLPGVGPALAAKLEKCGIKTVLDLLFHLPYRYQDRTRITAIQDCRAQDYCVIAGQICKAEIKYGRRRMLYCYVEDKTGLLKLRFFHFNQQQIASFNKKPFIRAFGEIREFGQQLEMIHPEYKLLEDNNNIVVDETLTPLYPSTEGLSQVRFRQLIRIALTEAQSVLSELEWMNGTELTLHNLLSLPDALYLLHNPTPDTSINEFEEGNHPALKRIVYEELLAQRLSMQFARKHRLKLKAPTFKECEPLIKRFFDQLPFTLTGAQERVFNEIKKDLNKDKPMLRLVQGDVGCGKTTVAALAALQAIGNGYQVALMAPTDLLSEQHLNNLSQWLIPLNISCGRLSGKMKIKERREILEKVALHQCDLLIGTHALFQEQVKFSKLGLIIIDEQHRFGVEQRLLLQQKGQQEGNIPHQLLMTATPIPRTLAMTQLAHLDLSTIDELPPGRIPITTAVINQDKRELIIERLNNAIESGKQAYWVCTLIEESEKLQCMAATVTQETLQNLLPHAKVGLIHGKMKAVEKEATMDAFKRGEINLLVATTVIEVGVDVSNASLMIIENAERLGLSQLHQLRGRVGRGENESFCLLLYQNPLTRVCIERLQVMKTTNDGFIIAEKDLQLRGGGEILGTRQTGYQQFKIANLQRDAYLLPEINQMAVSLMQKSPELAFKIAKQWLGNFQQFIQG